MVTKAEIEAVIGPIQVARGASSQAHPSPGMHARHYSPKTPLVLVEGGRLPSSGRGAYLWTRERADAARAVEMPADPRSYAALLYEKLHEADAERWDWIAVERPPVTPEWAAIHDRLERAAASVKP